MATNAKVVEEASKLAEKLTTAFFAKRLEVFLVVPGSHFNASTMDYADPGQRKAEVDAIQLVLCTVDMGLREVFTDSKKSRVLLSPKVLLEVSTKSG